MPAHFFAAPDYCGGVLLFGEVVVLGLVVLFGVVEFLRDCRERREPLLVPPEPVVVSFCDPGVLVVGEVGSVVVDPGVPVGVVESGVIGVVCPGDVWPGDVCPGIVWPGLVGLVGVPDCEGLVGVVCCANVSVPVRSSVAAAVDTTEMRERRFMGIS